jgi:acyl-CoA synthetase (AMP-forming)/AMP-acid ligase II
MDHDGYVYVVDRLKDMIVTGGENVYSTEVENAVAAHPAVANCAVIAVPNDLWGERVHAIVVRKPGTGVTEEQIRDHAKTLIAGYKAPRTVEFVDVLPATPTGKVLKREFAREILGWRGSRRELSGVTMWHGPPAAPSAPGPAQAAVPGRRHGRSRHVAGSGQSR